MNQLAFVPTAGLSYQFVQDLLRQIAASRAIGTGVGRARRKPFGQTPGNEPGHRIPARMIGDEGPRHCEKKTQTVTAGAQIQPCQSQPCTTG